MRNTLLLLICLIVASCTYIRNNNIGDVKAAEKIADQFHDSYKAKDYKSIYPIISKTYWKHTDSTSFRLLLEGVNKELGDLIEIKLADWQTSVTLGTKKTTGNYTLLFRNKYDKKEAVETFNFVFEDDGHIRIIGYNIAIQNMDIMTH
jgi:hypothetical protein